MSGYGVVLDPEEVAINRTPFDLNSGGVRVDQSGVDWGDAAISAYMADLIIGSDPVDYRIPNRIITIPLGLGMDDAGTFEADRAALQQKVGLLQREQGWLKRELQGGAHVFADVVNATLTIPDKTGEAAGVEDGVKLQLECKPDFYGDEVTLDSLSSSSGDIAAVLQQAGENAVVPGDYSARCRVIITNEGSNDVRGLLWAFRSGEYDADAPVTLEAEGLTPLNGATTTTHADTSGGHVVQHSSLPGGTWVPVLAASEQLHQGTYRIRCRSISASATPRLRLAWGVGHPSAVRYNDPVQLPGAGDFYLPDLGTVVIDPSPVGTTKWTGVIQAQVVADNDPVVIDKLYLQPINEGAGRLAYNPAPPVSSITAERVLASGASDVTGAGSVAWDIPAVAPGGARLASISFSGAARSHDLRLDTFGFAIPTGATVLGIEVALARRSSVPSAIADFGSMELMQGGTPGGTSYTGATWSTSWETATYGSPTDLWGRTWTPAQVNASGFGVSYSVLGDAAVGAVDAIGIIVYYELDGGFVVSSDAVIYGDQVAELRTDGMVHTADGTVYGEMVGFGAMPRLPNSGLEARPVELFIRPSRGDLSNTARGPFEAASRCLAAWRRRPPFWAGPRRRGHSRKSAAGFARAFRRWIFAG